MAAGISSLSKAGFAIGAKMFALRSSGLLVEHGMTDTLWCFGNTRIVALWGESAIFGSSEAPIIKRMLRKKGWHISFPIDRHIDKVNEVHQFVVMTNGATLFSTLN